MYKLYVYQNQKNGKLYFGQTVQTLEERAGKDGIRYKECTRFYRAIEKNGWHNFFPYVIALCKTVEEANELEEHAIAKARQELGEENVYNLLSGGLNRTASGEARRRMSDAKTGENNPNYGKTHSDETRKKISENLPDVSGENHPMFGKHHSEETKRKLSEAHKGKLKGKTWTVIDGKRVWYKEGST